MTLLNRRSLVRFAGAAYLSHAIRPALAQAPSTVRSGGSFPIRLGAVTSVGPGQSPEDAVKRIRDLGLSSCQISISHLTTEAAEPLKRALAKYGVEATAVMELGPGRKVWNLAEGPQTVGLIPPATRRARIDALKVAADVAGQCGIPSVHTHCGFIPEDPNDSMYPQAVAAVKEVAVYCRERGRSFLCETGQETPITLLRMIEDVGLDNVFVNLDLANLILYGKGNPVDAMDVIGHRVRGIHAKDGLFPTDPRGLGKEVAIGEGKVDFPTVLMKLKQVNYHGPMTIEREIKGEQQKNDILQSEVFLNALIAKTYA